jgi:hypothetical protein
VYASPLINVPQRLSVLLGRQEIPLPINVDDQREALPLSCVIFGAKLPTGD